jgi:F0F1-type ATP synthase membrane subunit b/b'
MRAKIHEEVEDAKSEVALLRQLSERDQLRIKSEIKVMQDEAERERMNLHNQATLVVQQRTDQADRLLADVQQRAVGLNAEAEDNLARARAEATRLLENARKFATDTIGRARERAEHLATRSNEHASRMLADAELRLSAIEEQRYAIEEFAFELRSLSSSDPLASVGDPEAPFDLLEEEHPLPVRTAELSLVREPPAVETYGARRFSLEDPGHDSGHGEGRSDLADTI